MIIPATLFIALLLSGCSDSNELNQSAIKRQNLKGEYISRSHNERFYEPPPPLRRTPTVYPWESGRTGTLPIITKEFFRCKGSLLNPELTEVKGKEVKRFRDCGGNDKHGLPIKEGEEFVYPILIDILNDLQAKTGKRVVVTSGHRCPAHNAYNAADLYSKHMIGAEVSFYLQGMEESPEEAVALIIDSYGKESDDYRTFNRYTNMEETDVSTPPWHNKEIFIKIYQRNEGRNHDNRHPFPYISIQVRYDRKNNERVLYNWERAYRGYLRR